MNVIRLAKLKLLGRDTAALMKLLRENVGTNDDWPIEIKSDDPDISRRLAELLTNIEQHLKELGLK